MISLFEEFSPLHATLPQKLESQRLELRCYQSTDVSVIRAVFDANRERLRNGFFSRAKLTQSENDVEAFVQQVRQLWNVREAFHFSIWEKQQQSYVGEIFIACISWQVPKGDVGYFVVREFEGQRMITEAVCAILPFAFDRLQMNKLQIRCPVDNLRSQRVAERSGFKIEGVLRNDRVNSDGHLPLDIVYYGMTPGDFRKIERKPPDFGKPPEE
ncbi:MAG: GNAT family N-acetyltransferase [Bacteroidetes bacterium]|nr:GNAT family N-acetyltransferase [Bacteroidota bacterium]MCW5897304.1 GNAT family N-acetyltransferase [Bacteroidota bacterium]